MGDVVVVCVVDYGCTEMPAQCAAKMSNRQSLVAKLAPLDSAGLVPTHAWLDPLTQTGR